MNDQDRAQIESLNQRQQRLETALAQLKADLQQLNAQITLPPIPIAEAVPSEPPPLPPMLPPVPLPAPAPEPAIPTTLPPVPVGPGFEVQFGRWLARIGVVFALLTLVFVSVWAYKEFHQYIGPWAKLGAFTLISTGFIIGGLRLERRSRDLVVYGRTLAGGGLACLYYTLYGATYVEQLRVIHNYYLGGCVLLAWSAAVLWLAERRKSELLSIFAISLAYFSSAITPVGDFTMVADLLLAATAVVFLVRNAWTGLSYLCLIGTYLGFVRQLFVSTPDAPFNFDFVRSPEFWPWAIYLTGAWVIFTAGVFLARKPGFDGEKRDAFLSLNNGAWVGLLLVAAQVAHHGHLGGQLLLAGWVLLGMCGLARLFHTKDTDLADAYLWQGLAIASAGLVLVYHGVTRGLIITAESVFLAAAAGYSRKAILHFGAGCAALLGTAFLLNETILKSPFPWWLMAAGLAAMVANTLLSRASLSRILYILLALLLGVRWIYGVVPHDEITLALFALATALIGGGLLGSSGTFIRAGLVINLVGCLNYLAADPNFSAQAFTWADAFAFALFLAQPAALHFLGRARISGPESWAVSLASSLMAWLFVSNSITAANSNNLTLGWALLALALIVLGFVAQERRQRWCGLGILAAAFVRVGVHDFWGFNDGGKIATFFAVTVICLGLSFLYYKFAERFKEWL